MELPQEGHGVFSRLHPVHPGLHCPGEGLADEAPGHGGEGGPFREEGVDPFAEARGDEEGPAADHVAALQEPLHGGRVGAGAAEAPPLHLHHELPLGVARRLGEPHRLGPHGVGAGLEVGPPPSPGVRTG